MNITNKAESADAIPFTGWARRRKTRWSVRGAEIASRLIITIGGIGTIVSVLTVCIFLVYKVLPLAGQAHVVRTQTHALPWMESRAPIQFRIDEYQMLGFMLFAENGDLCVFRLDDGTLVQRKQLFPGRAITASAFDQGDEAVFGFANGELVMAKIGFSSQHLEESAAPDLLSSMQEGEIRAYEEGVVKAVASGQFRAQSLRLDVKDPIEAKIASSVLLLDLVVRPNSRTVAAITEDGRISINTVEERTNLITDETTYELSGGDLSLPELKSDPRPSYLMLTDVGDNAFVLWSNGRLLRFDTARLSKIAVAEDIKVTDSAQVTAARFLIGRTTLLVGDSIGNVRAWFRVLDPAGKDGTRLVATRDFKSDGSAVTCLGVSERTRIMCAGHADGGLRMFFVTNERLLNQSSMADHAVPRIVVLSPKDDGLIALGNGVLETWQVDNPHPEINFRSLFQPIWYEGYVQPGHTWQSSSGTDSSESKYGLIPLIFGTIKATVYSMLIGVPLALLAAIYTSEFMNPRVKAFVKPSIEMMASLPSVVLGFLAALFFAPIVENFLSAVLAGLLTIPLTLLLGAYLWQLLPEDLSLRMSGWRILFVALTFPIACVIALIGAPLGEHLIFGAEGIKGWLNAPPESTSAVPGWICILFPLAAAATALLMSTTINPIVRGATAGVGRFGCAVVDFLKFVFGLGTACVVALLVAWLLNLAGLDPRNPTLFGLPLLGTFVQRNALVVGFMMGFAIIPIVYTLAEDALSAVPSHLRSASLGCGATPWQTAVRIIIPTAMSGLFSAIMIGLGRAVGETMIVLMATGNTPIMDWNVFNGFRTLAANIATELPETTKDGTHYRTLYLAALVLLCMTLVLNTAAEIVRMRFRKRAYQL